MNPRGNTGREHLANRSGTSWPQAMVRPSHLYLVTDQELQDLLVWIARGTLPPDFELKLVHLAKGGLSHSFIEQNCRAIVELLIAANQGAFKQLSGPDRDLLLKVLAYVRKHDDAIPDYRPNGYSDDQLEVRAALIDLQPTIQAFKAWRLKHQVPTLWWS